MAIATSQFTIIDLTDITVGSEPVTPVLDQLWLDSSVLPNTLMRWSGTLWEPASPRLASEIGAYDKELGEQLATKVNGANGLSYRMNSAEQKITATAITQTVEDTSTLLAKKSYVDLTAGAFALAIGETIRDEYGNTISNVQGNFIFTSGGMEIKMTGAEFSTFYSANKIEFRQNGNVLQWLSGNKNYITDLIITGNLALPKHKFETLANGHTVLRYIGG